MWTLDNLTPYAAERNWARDREGRHQWVVAVRATFDIGADGTLSIADEQPGPPLAPEYHGDPASTSLRLDSDLLAQKPGTDIVLDACAHAPGGRPASAVEVSMHVADVSKRLVVHGPRFYRHGSLGTSITSAEPFVTQPIRYEAAFGGSDLKDDDLRRRRIDERNPLGRGVAVDARSLHDQPAHTIEYPGGDAAKKGPAGFGPILAFWSPRRQRAGTFDRHWEETKKPLLPDDYDPAFALSAPDDQRPGKPLQGGEPVLITNMSPSGALRFELPRITLALETSFGLRSTPHAALLTTVFIVPGAAKLSMIWQSALSVPVRDADYLDFTTITEGATAS